MFTSLQPPGDITVLGYYLDPQCGSTIIVKDFAQTLVLDRKASSEDGIQPPAPIENPLPKNIQWMRFVTEPVSGKVGVGALFFPQNRQIQLSQELTELLALVFEGFLERPAAANTPDVGNIVLSDRQSEILRLITDGLTNYQIARRLSVSESTVKQETIRIYRQLGVASREGAAAMAKSGVLKLS